MKTPTDAEFTAIQRLAARALEAGTGHEKQAVVLAAVTFLAGVALADPDFREVLTRLAAGERDALQELLG